MTTLMLSDPTTCRPEDDLLMVAQRMRDGGRFSLPVVGVHREVLGVLTNRDVCNAAATGKHLSDIRVASVVRRWGVTSC